MSDSSLDTGGGVWQRVPTRHMSMEPPFRDLIAFGLGRIACKLFIFVIFQFMRVYFQCV